MTVRPLASVTAALAIFAVQVAPALAHDPVAGTPDVTITIGSGLSDRKVRVEPGAIVRFLNRDDERHRMRSRSGERGFDTGNLEPGEAGQVRLSVAGTYTYLDERDRDDGRYHGAIVVERSSPDANAAAPASSATVTIGDRVFLPGSTTIEVGGAVTFRNDDGEEHTATSSGGGGIDSGTLASGDTYEKTFSEAGSYEFLCMFHSDMRGTIEVVGGAQAGPEAPAPAPDNTPSPTPSSVTAPNTEAVDIVDFAFEPASVELPEGATVLWTNTGVAPHTVSAEDGSFDSGTLDPGASFEHTFTTPGTYGYLCQVHPEMTGTIEIVASEPESIEPAAASTSAATTSAPTQGALPGIVLSVTLVGVASALFARLLRGTAKRGYKPE
jgi:plastocyanin